MNDQVKMRKFKLKNYEYKRESQHSLYTDLIKRL